MGPNEAVRPISVSPFLAVFLPTAAAVGTALLVLLFRSFAQSESLAVLEAGTKGIELQVKELAADSQSLFRRDLPELKMQLQAIKTEWQKVPGGAGGNESTKSKRAP